MTQKALYPSPDAGAKNDGASSPFLIISGHDFRSKRQASMHFIARELAKLGPTKFFSIGYSPLSLIKHDPRASLWSRANHIENYNGIDAYLWKSLWHPINLHRPSLTPLEKVAFKAYSRQVPAVLKQWIAEAKTIILESGMSVIFFNLIKEINPGATILYLCSDALDTIGCSSVLTDELRRIAPKFDRVLLPSPKLVSEFPPGCAVVYIPHGMDSPPTDISDLSPYQTGTNLVSVGSMLFDRTFFEIAAAAFPEYNFYVIGGGKNAEGLSGPNIRVFGEMPFKDTLPYIKHAQVGIAPYEGGKISSYLVDTSMKLLQFEAYGLPAVCPHLAAGQSHERFGYDTGNPESIAKAIRAALAHGRFKGIIPLSWAEVTARTLNPDGYSDTAIVAAP